MNSSPAGDDIHDFQTVPRAQSSLGKFRWGNGFTVQFNHDAARRQALGLEKVLEGTWQWDCDCFAVGNDLFHTFTLWFCA